MFTGLTTEQIAGWIARQYERWLAWAEAQGPAWLTLPTGNPRFPTCGHIFVHAFTPMHRYADMAQGAPPVDDAGVDCTDWPTVAAWVRRCFTRYQDALATLTPERASKIVEFPTRSAGVFKVSAGGFFFHACTHCFWHLGGLAALLRREGINPPPASDLLFWLRDNGL